MKLKFLFFVAVAILSSCNSEAPTIEKSESVEMQEITFSLKALSSDVIPFRSSDDNTTASSQSLYDNISKLKYVITKDGERVDSNVVEVGPALDCVTLTMAKGSAIEFIGYTPTFGELEPYFHKEGADMYKYNMGKEIFHQALSSQELDGQAYKEVLLTRKTGALILELSDLNSSSTGDQTIEIEYEASKGWTYNEMKTIQESQTKSFAISDIKHNMAIPRADLWENRSSTVIIKVKDHGGEVTRQHQIDNVTVYANRKTIIKGAIYNTETKFQISISTDWGEDNVVEIP